MKKTKAVFNQRIATKLVQKGFEICDTAINRANPKYLVFYFELSPELLLAFEEAKSELQ